MFLDLSESVIVQVPEVSHPLLLNLGLSSMQGFCQYSALKKKKKNEVWLIYSVVLVLLIPNSYIYPLNVFSAV